VFLLLHSKCSSYILLQVPYQIHNLLIQLILITCAFVIYVDVYRWVKSYLYVPSRGKTLAFLFLPSFCHLFTLTLFIFLFFLVICCLVHKCTMKVLCSALKTKKTPVYLMEKIYMFNKLCSCMIDKCC
jgi:Trk-type K+ transport system membrane component